MKTLKQDIGLYTDYYELTMAQGYFYSGKKDEITVFDYYYRSNPYDGGYLVFAGLQDLLNLLKNFDYSLENINYLRNTGLKEEFLDYLKDFKFTATIYSVQEGEIVFPNEPIIRVEGNIIEAQLVETLLLNYINFQSLIATKACRIRSVIGDKTFADFGLRRAQGLGSIQASRAAAIGGANSTSNVYAGYNYNIPVSGTQAHAWIQSFENEIDAFRSYSEINPDNTTLLVDTYNTLKSGVPNAIIIAKELESKGYKMKAIRLDSGDLAYLSKKARAMFDKEGLEYIEIFASNQLNEYVIKSLTEQGAVIDGYGIGTELITGKDTGALNGVYKLVECNNIPRIKISENIEKVTLPGKKKIVRYLNKKNMFVGDALLLDTESIEDIHTIYHPFEYDKYKDVENFKYEILTSKVMDKGEILIKEKSIQEINKYLQKRFAQLPFEHKRFISPHIYKISLSDKLFKLRSNMVKNISDNIK